MSQRQLFKKMGVLSLSLGMLASPLIFADRHDMAADEVEESMTTQSADLAAHSADSDADHMANPGSTSDPDTPAEEPGFGNGMEPMPNSEGAAQSDEQGGKKFSDEESQSIQ